MSGNLPDGCTQGDIDRAIEEPPSGRRQRYFAPPVAKWQPVEGETIAHEYRDGRFLGVRTTRRDGDGNVMSESFARAEDIASGGGTPAAPKPSQPETPREVVAELLRLTRCFAEWEDAKYERYCANWLARYDAAVKADGELALCYGFATDTIALRP